MESRITSINIVSGFKRLQVEKTISNIPGIFGNEYREVRTYEAGTGLVEFKRSAPIDINPSEEELIGWWLVR